jgi:Helix-turn-helix domain
MQILANRGSTSSWLRPRREKVFQNHETRVPLDREAKVRIMALARALKHRTEPRRHYGVLTGKFIDVLHALLWLIHDGKSGQCNPAYATIADKAGCCVNTVCAAIKALERAGLLSWVNRITRIRVRERDLFGRWALSWRVVRTSNAYVFHDPKTAARQTEASKTKFWSEPLDPSFKKETKSGARLVGAPVIDPGESVDDLLMRHGWYRGSGKR